VKNVAGFDLVRLVIGAWGTLGVLTEVTVRLRARPEVDATVAVAVSASAADMVVLAARLRALPFTPYAAELVSEALAARLGLEPRLRLLVRLGGSADAVRAHRDALRPLGDVREVDVDIWAALRRAEPSGAPCARLSRRASRFSDTWADARRLTDGFDDALVHGAPLRGVVRCIFPPAGEPADFESRLLHTLAAPFDGTQVFERLPTPLWNAVAPSVVTDRLSQGIRAAYDPHCLLNPGILGDCPDR
jgi:glycolate oxidase FAD binding subunit